MMLIRCCEVMIPGARYFVQVEGLQPSPLDPEEEATSGDGHVEVAQRSLGELKVDGYSQPEICRTVSFFCGLYSALLVWDTPQLDIDIQVCLVYPTNINYLCWL